MSKLDKLSQNDKIIMEIIWEQGETTNSAILNELEGRSNWTRHTVKTYITRLREKGFVGVNQINTRMKRYYPLIDKDEYLAIETSNYLNNHYRDLAQMIAGLVENEQITDKEIHDLEQYIKSLKAKKQGE